MNICSGCFEICWRWHRDSSKFDKVVSARCWISVWGIRFSNHVEFICCVVVGSRFVVARRFGNAKFVRGLLMLVLTSFLCVI
jgi:hypothetical protein